MDVTSGKSSEMCARAEQPQNAPYGILVSALRSEENVTRLYAMWNDCEPMDKSELASVRLTRPVQSMNARVSMSTAFGAEKRCMLEQPWKTPLSMAATPGPTDTDGKLAAFLNAR